MLFCRVTLGKSFLQFSTMKMAHAPPGHHSVIGRPSVNGLAYAEYVIYRGEQVGAQCKWWAFRCIHKPMHLLHNCTNLHCLYTSQVGGLYNKPTCGTYYQRCNWRFLKGIYRLSLAGSRDMCMFTCTWCVLYKSKCVFSMFVLLLPSHNI